MKEQATYTRGRRLAIGLNVLVVSLLAPLVGGLLLYLLFRPELRRRLDVTARSAFTLAERTQKVLASLSSRAEPLDVYTCFRPTYYNESGVPVPGLDAVEALIGTHCNDLLREFEVQARGRLRLHLLDANVTGHFPRIEELSKRIGEPAYNVCAVTAGERLQLLKLHDLAAFDEGTRTTEAMQRPTLAGFRDEEALTRAILAVIDEKSPRVAFLRGHGERAPDAAGVDAAGHVGLSRFAHALTAQNYSLGSLALAEGKPLTRDDVDVLVVAEPVRQFADHEVASLIAYAKGGGKLLLLLHPDSSTSLEQPLLNEVFGLSRSYDPVCQETQLGTFRSTAPNVFDTEQFSDHTIVKPLKAKKLKVHWENVSSFTAYGRIEQTDLELFPLVYTSNSAWVDIAPRNLQFDPKAETRAPQCLGYAALLKSGGRMVCFGSAAVLDDRLIESATGNRDLGLNAVDWLAQREQFISIAPRPYDEVRVDLTPPEFSTIFLYVVLGVPALSLLLGVAVFWMRRT
jgi:ABC transporter family protein